MKKILLMSAVATSGMTLFSYIISRIFRRKFQETMLLNQMVFPGAKKEKKNHPAGFAIHYGVGTLFSLLYYKLWKKYACRPGYFNSSVLGFFNGLAGVAGWHTFFSLHPEPPGVRLRGYYIHLLAAHIVFGFLNGLVFKLKFNSNSGSFFSRNKEF